MKRERMTLDQLEGKVWGQAAPSDTGLVKTCHRLRTKPVGDFSVEDLRVMIGQSIGLRLLIPIALDALEREPLAEGDFYPGDLLNSVLRVEPAFWAREFEWRDRVRKIVSNLSPVPKEVAGEVASFKEASG